MIVRMQSVLVFCLADAREAALEHLRALGVLHLTPIAPLEGPDLNTCRQGLDRARQAADILKSEKPRATPPTGVSPPPDLTTAIVDRIHILDEQRAALEEEHETLLHERHRLAPFGHFDPSRLRALAGSGITVRLFEEDPERPLSVPSGAQRIALGGEGRLRPVALISQGAFTVTGGHELPIPERSLAEVESRLREIEATRDRISVELASHATTRQPAVAAAVREWEDRLAFAEARYGMGSTAAIAYLRGYCPEDAVPKIQQAAREQGWGLAVNDPAPDDHRVPTLIRNPAWVRPIRAVFEVIGVVPGYREIDISAAFLLFFSIFFAMIIGDAGYGLLFLGATLLARRRMRAAPAYPFTLLTVLSVATIAWGLLTGNVFAMQVLPAPLEHLRVGWLLESRNIMRLCFLLGATHLTLAHLWNALRVRNSLQALAQLGWVAITWSMYFLAVSMILMTPRSPAAVPLLIGGGLAVALFMTPPRRFKQEWYGHVMLPLDLVGNFVDVVSYIRLFAVGMASYAVAANFNLMAAEQGFASPWRGLAAAAILFAGHALNIVLCAMGVLVHGVRLNTLEFSRHIGMQWSGLRYTPFVRRHARDEA